MTYQYKVSFIVPVYNKEKCLETCVDSLLNQTYPHCEIILVNDGSTDRSKEICNRYASDNVKVINQANAGVSCARNAGIEIATGEYIIFVDSDDWMEPNAVSTLMEQPQIADLTFFGSVFHYPDRIALSYIPEKTFYKSFSELQKGLIDLLKNPKHPDYVGFTWNKMFRHDIIQQYHLRFIEKLSIREDEAFTFAYATHCNTLATLPNLLYHYQYSPNGLTWGDKKSAEEYTKLADAYIQSVKAFTKPELEKYLVSHAAEFYMLAIRKSQDQTFRENVISKYWNLKNKYKFKIKLKPIYRILTNTKSSSWMKFYFKFRATYHHNK